MTLFSLTFLAWWLVASKTDWPRHLLPGLCIVALTAADGLVWSIRLIFKSLNGLSSGWFRAALMAIILAGVAVDLVAVPLNWQKGQVQGYLNTSLLPAQTELAAKPVQIGQQGSTIAMWDWFQVPEMSFLSQVRFIDLKLLDSQGLPDGPIYVLASKELYFGANTDLVLQQYCGDIVYENEGYVLYRYKKRPSNNYFEGRYFV